MGGLDLRQLRHFLAIVETGHFGRAAQQLGISKQGISNSVAALEESLGARLFERGQFGAVTTEFGVVLTQHAKLILAAARKARLEIDGLREEHRGEVTFAVGSSFSEFIAPRAIADLVDSTFVGVWRHDLTERTVMGAFERHGLAVPNMIDCDNFLVTRGLVLDEGCLVIANRLFFERELDNGTIVERVIPDLTYDVTYALFHRKDTVLGRATLALMDQPRQTAVERFSENIVPELTAADARPDLRSPALVGFLYSDAGGRITRLRKRLIFLGWHRSCLCPDKKPA